MKIEERAMRALTKKPMTVAQLATRLQCPRIRAFRTIKKLYTAGVLWRVAQHRSGERGPAAFVWGVFNPEDPALKERLNRWRV